MKFLKDYHFLSTYIKSRNEIYKEFYKPCMENSVKYDRITGYFGSSVFLVLNESLKSFIENKGKIRIICSPVLREEDIDAIYEGYTDKAKQNIEKNVNEVICELEKDFPNSFRLLSKMISVGIIEIKLAVFRKDTSYFRLMHDKVGIFTDIKGNSVAFRGSFNETFMGISKFGNGESFDAFTNWEGEKDNERVQIVIRQFEDMWFDNDPEIRTFEMPEESLEKMKQFVAEKKIEELYLNDEIENELYGKKWYADLGERPRSVRNHQEKALNNWEDNNRRGLLEMCTGSGKTFIALCAIREAIFDRNEVPIILVPTKLLFNQWKNEIIESFTDQVTILEQGAGNPLDTSRLLMYSNSNPNINMKRCILATYSIASKENFINNVQWGKHIFYVCDEVHNIGSPKNRKLLEVVVGSRMGLSATPKRYFDKIGTEKMIEFFGGIIEPKYTIQNAIADGVLVEYYYEIEEVNLNQAEQSEWNDLTRQINRRYAIVSSKNKIENINDDKNLEKLLFQRADLVKKAEEKVFVADRLLKENYKEGQKWLVYLDDSNHLLELYNILIAEKQFKNQVFQYHTNYKGDLETNLNHFKNNGGILLSINCLDEGVDIPSIDNALILSSSKNPRQYIQRRGRVLRRSEGKLTATIYDCFVSPNNLVKDEVSTLSIINGEIARAAEFAENAINSEFIKIKIDGLMKRNGIDISEGGFGIDEECSE